MNKNYQQLSNELDEIMQELQEQDIDFDEAIKLHNQAKKIIDIMNNYINNAEIKIKKINKSS
jgi:exodeoxyribonuclease VII small subunit